MIEETDLEPLGEQYKESLEELRKIVEEEDKKELQKSILTKRGKNRKRKRPYAISDDK